MPGRKTAGEREPADALAVLTQDHRKILGLFDDFAKLLAEDEGNDAAKQTLVERTCSELAIHAQLEEELFYPALREALGEILPLDEAEVEHDLASQISADLEAMDPGDPLYDARFNVLGEYVRHHIEQEQEKLFPKARKAKLALAELGRELLERRNELALEFGMPEDGGVEEDDEDGVARRLGREPPDGGG